MKKKFIRFFQDKSFGQKKAPAGSLRAKKKDFEKHKQKLYKSEKESKNYIKVKKKFIQFSKIEF